MHPWLAILALVAPLQDPPPVDAAAPDDAGAAARAFAPPENFVVIVGEEEGDERRVLVGSRLPRKPRYSGLSVATSTGLMGLTPGSGMDGAGGNITRKIRSKSCSSDDERMSRRAACFLAGALDAEAEGDLYFAFGALNAMALSPDFSGFERLAAARHFYRLAETLDDRAARFAGLALMAEMDALPREEEGSIRRTMVAMALQDGDRDYARDMLATLVERELADPRSLANYAILLGEAGDGRAVPVMEQAIAAADADGDDVPQGWRDFVRRRPVTGPATGSVEGG